MEKKLSIATVLFTYSRPEHTKLVLNALHNNTVAPEKLIIFQDGRKENTETEKWESVNSLISDISWCDAETVISPVNKGLAKSISQGITEVLSRYDAVIVLEDDCVTHPKLMEYMISALNKYAGCRQVWHINGYSWEADIEPNGYDAFFCGRTGSWGWATWKDRWNVYKEDYKILSRIKKDEFTKRQFDIWGKDLESYLYGNINGTCDSWATFWAMAVIEQHGYCLTPYKSLINNIGFDGTGVHCATGVVPKTKMLEEDRTEELRLPEKVVFPVNYEEAFSKVFNWVPQVMKLEYYYNLVLMWMKLKNASRTVADFFQGRDIRQIAIWGTGRLCDFLLEELQGRVNIVSLIESLPTTGCYQGLPVKKIEDLSDNIQMIVVIPSYDMDEIRGRMKAAGKKYDAVGLDEVIEKSLNCLHNALT